MYNALISEELSLRSLWRKKQDYKHILKFYDSISYPETCFLMECLDITLEDYLK